MNDKNNNNNKNTLITFAGKIGKLEQGLKDLEKHFTNHLSSHRIDRVMQWFIIGLQIVVLMFLGYLKFNTL